MATAGRRLLLLNPNTSTAFTQRIAAAAESVASTCNVTIEVAQPDSGPASIESAYDECLSAAPTLKAYLERDSCDGVVLACFSDHPVALALREIAGGRPVVGLLDGALERARLLGDRYAIVTTSASWRPLLASGVRRLGAADRCAGIVAVDAPVLAFAEANAALDARVAEAAARAAEDAEVVILGCAGMGASTAAAVRAALGPRVPVVEPVPAAVAACAGLLAAPDGAPPPRPARKALAGGMDPIFATAYA
jgi:allantoin racemase